jgi:hypothetical protein
MENEQRAASIERRRAASIERRRAEAERRSNDRENDLNWKHIYEMRVRSLERQFNGVVDIMIGYQVERETVERNLWRRVRTLEKRLGVGRRGGVDVERGEGVDVESRDVVDEAKENGVDEDKEEGEAEEEIERVTKGTFFPKIVFYKDTYKLTEYRRPIYEQHHDPLTAFNPLTQEVSQPQPPHVKRGKSTPIL